MFLAELLYGIAHNLVWFKRTHPLIDDTGIGIDKRNTRIIRSSRCYCHWTRNTNLVIILKKQKRSSSHERKEMFRLDITLDAELKVELMGSVMTDFGFVGNVGEAGDA